VSDEQRPRATPRPRPGGSTAARPSPRPRVAGSRRDRDDPGQPAAPRQGAVDAATPGTAVTEPASEAAPRVRPRRSRPAVTTATDPGPTPRRGPLLPLTLLVLVLLAAGAVGHLLWQRANPSSVDASVFAAARENVEALYAYDYRDPEGSVQGKLDVLHGELREQYETDLQGGILDTYEQVSATTRYEIVDVGLRRINDAQDDAQVVVFGSYVVESVTSGEQPAPEGSECQVTPEGAQACVQTIDVGMVKDDGVWKIDELTLRTTS
jgi:hypothetical protein